MNKKTLLHILIGLCIGLICLFLWLHFTDWEQVLYYIGKIKPVFLIYATFFYLLSYIFRASRLYTLIHSSGHYPTLTMTKNIIYVFAGNLLNYLIPRAGEVGKGFFYKQNHQIKWSDSLPCIVVDKIYDTFAIFVVLVLLPLTSIVFSPALRILLLLLLIVFCLGISILIFATISEKKVVFVLHKLLFFLPQSLAEKILSFLQLFVAGLASIQKKGSALVLAGVYTVAASLTDALFFLSIFWSLGIYISFIHVLCGYTLIFLSYALPHPPAQIGSNEMIMMIVFSVGFGYDNDQMSSVMATSHLLTMFVIFIIGSVSLWLSGFRYIDFLKNKETTNE